MKVNKYLRNKVATEVFYFLKLSGDASTIAEMSGYVAKKLNLTNEDKKERFPSGDIKYINMIRFALLTYKKAGLVENISKGVWGITEKGRNLKSISAEDYNDLQNKITRENNRSKRSNGKGIAVQHSLFKEVNKSILSEKEFQLLSEIVRQNNFIIERVLGKKG